MRLATQREGAVLSRYAESAGLIAPRALHLNLGVPITICRTAAERCATSIRG